MPGKKTPIFPGREACLLLKRSPEMTLIGKTEQQRDFAQGTFRRGEHGAGLLDAPRTHILPGAHAKVLLKTRREVGGVNADIRRDLLERRDRNRLLMQALLHPAQPAWNATLSADFPQSLCQEYQRQSFKSYSRGRVDMKELIIDPSGRIAGTSTDKMGHGMRQRPQVCALTKVRHKLDMHTAPLFMPAIGMLKAGRVIDQRAWPQQLAPTVRHLLASAIENKAEKSVSMSVQRERTSCQIAGEIYTEICGRPVSMAGAHKCLWIERNQSDGNSPIVYRKRPFVSVPYCAI